MIPRPRTNLLIYHGAFAPRGCRRVAAALAARGSQDSSTEAPPSAEVEVAASAMPAVGALPADEHLPNGELGGSCPTAAPRPPPADVRYVRPRHFAWADLLRRTFETDILACPDCGGRLRLLAMIEAPAVIAKILGHLNLPLSPPSPAPPRECAWLPGLAGVHD